jgi:hypothetical protein
MTHYSYDFFGIFVRKEDVLAIKNEAKVRRSREPSSLQTWLPCVNLFKSMGCTISFESLRDDKRVFGIFKKQGYD